MSQLKQSVVRKTASMVLAAQAVKKMGKPMRFFSAGNTGALLAAGLFIVGRIKKMWNVPV